MPACVSKITLSRTLGAQVISVAISMFSMWSDDRRTISTSTLREWSFVFVSFPRIFLWIGGRMLNICFYCLDEKFKDRLMASSLLFLLFSCLLICRQTKSPHVDTVDTEGGNTVVRSDCTLRRNISKYQWCLFMSGTMQVPLQHLSTYDCFWKTQNEDLYLFMSFSGLFYWCVSEIELPPVAVQ